MNEERRDYDKQIHELRQDFREFRDRIEPVIEVWETLSGLARFLRWVGVVAKWLSVIGAPILMAYTYFHNKG